MSGPARSEEEIREVEEALGEPTPLPAHCGRFRRGCSRLFYGPGDWLVKQTTARDRRAIGAWLLLLWLGPGTVAWVFLIDALWFVGWMSLFALWWTGLGTVGTETPVETEDQAGPST